MTDFTYEEMREIILRTLNENAARMRKKYKLKRASRRRPNATPPQRDLAVEQALRSAAPRNRSGG